MRRAAIAVVWLIVMLAPAFAAESEGEGEAAKSNEAAADAAGEVVQLQLKLHEGVKLPEEFKPQVYLEEERPQFKPWQPKNKEEVASDPNQLAVEAKGDGAFLFKLADPARKFYVGIHEPGFLRFFEAGPFAPSDVKDGQLEVDVPAAASLSFGLKFDTSADKQPFDTVKTNLMGVKQDRRTYFVAHDSETKANESALFEANDLPPGLYMLNLSTSGSPNAAAAQNAADPSRFRSGRQMNLVAGKNDDAVVDYVPFDEKSFRGDHDVELRVTAFGGSSVAGKPLKIAFNDPNYGPITVFDGPVPEDGIVRIEGLGDMDAISGPFVVLVGDQHLGAFRLKPDDELQTFEFSLPPGPGDAAPDIEYTDVRTGETRKLSASLGKPVFLEFWATWCGPCQPPLEKVNKLIDHEKQWAGKIDFLPISIDNEIGMVNPHLEGKGWTHLPQYWTGIEGEVGFGAPAPKKYVVRGIPDAMLIDAEGKIVWRGHPMSVDLAAKINEILGLSPEGKSQDAEASDNSQS